MSADSSGAVPLCKKCGQPLMFDIVCSSCGCIGEDRSQVRRCRQCYGYMYEDSATCPWCDHNRTFSASKKPCFLCCNLLPSVSSVCGTCQTPQDMAVLKDQMYKKCLNTNCCAIVNICARNCYICNYQQDPSIPGFYLFSSGIPRFLQQTHLQANVYKPNSSPALSQTVHHNTSSSAAESKVKNTSAKSKGGMKKCIFCDHLFSELLEKCDVCFAQQEVDLLKTLEFYYCTSGCGAILCVAFHKHCFRCKEQQQHPLSTFPGLEVFPKEVVLCPPMSVENPQDWHSVAQSEREPEKPIKKPCILCGTPIPISSAQCFNCQTTQIEDELKYSRCKLCCNPKCEAPMSVDLQVCYRCNQDQNRNCLTFITDPQYQVPALSTGCNSRGESNMTDKEKSTKRDGDESSWDMLDSMTKDGRSETQSQMLGSACDKNLEKSDTSKTTKVELNRYDQQHSDGKITTEVTCKVDDSAKSARKDDRKYEDVSASGTSGQKSNSNFSFEEKRLVKAVSSQ